MPPEHWLVIAVIALTILAMILILASAGTVIFDVHLAFD